MLHFVLESTLFKKIDWQLTAGGIYLLLPNILFGIYLSNIALIISILATAYCGWIIYITPNESNNLSKTTVNKLLLFLICVVWVYWSGMTGQFYSNTDWPVRLTVLNDLIQNHWPVVYEHENQNFFLRAPIGYYLPSALIGKIFNSYDVGLWSLFSWTVIGTFIAINISVSKYNSRKALMGVGIIILFSGMDIIGYLIREHGNIHLGDHLEVWAGRWQYSSNTTLLFWVPNHAISAWIFTSLMIRKQDDPIFWMISPMLLAATLIFSPLSFIGCFLLYIFYFYKKIYNSLNNFNNYQISSFIGSLFFLSGAHYILSDIKSIPNPGHSHKYSLIVTLLWYSCFILLEFGLQAFFLKFISYNKRWLYVSCATLILLPFAPEIGPGSDLVMRASIPPLFCLCLLSVDALLIRHLAYSKLKIESLIFIAILVVGSLTPGMELARTLKLQGRKFVPSDNIYEITKGKAGHYYAVCGNHTLIKCND